MMALPFTLKSILMQKKNDGNLCTKFVVNLFAKTKGKSQVLSQNPSIRKSKDSPSPNSPLTKLVVPAPSGVRPLRKPEKCSIWSLDSSETFFLTVNLKKKAWLVEHKKAVN
jgi:hypothetical protein